MKRVARTRDVFICSALGPMYEKTYHYEVQAICNRVRDHEGPHRQYDPATYHVVREWIEVYEPQPRRKIR